MTKKQTKIFIALAVILFFSGSFSLIYQIAWVRFLTLLLGSTTMGITTVVASFMSGLAIGSWLALKYLIKSEKPLKVYAFLELIISLTAMVSPLLFKWAFASLPDILQKFGDADLSITVLRILFSAVIMLVPTICMGAALPVLGKYLQQHSDLAERRITIIYGLNTIGACAGCVASGYFLLRQTGLINTIYFTALANALLPAAILMLPKIYGNDENTAKPLKNPKNNNKIGNYMVEGEFITPAVRNVILMISAFVGFIGLSSELVWARLIVLTVGGSIYAYSTILAVYLFFYGVGAALGGASLKILASRFGAKTFAVSKTVFLFLLMLISAATVISIAVANRLPDYYIRNFSFERSSTLYGLFVSQMFPAIMLMSAATMMSGIFFSYGLFLLKQHSDDPAANTSFFYTWNTVGGIAGSVAAAFLLIPVFGLDMTLRITSTVLIALSLLWMMLIKTDKKIFITVSGVFCLSLVWFFIPRIDRIAVTSGAGIYTPMFKSEADVLEHGISDILKQEIEQIYYKDGFTATITVSRHLYTKEIAISTNGKSDGSSYTDMPTQKLCGHFPALFHPYPRTACVIGYGTGTTVGSLALHPDIKVDAVEIEPAIMEAAEYMNEFNNDPMSRENVKLFLTDGRLHLQRSVGKYDVITSEPSNPWLAGVSDLFTVEYYQLAHNALKPDGVFGQWIQMYNLEPEALQLVFRSFRDVFPKAYMIVLNAGNDLMLIGCKGSYLPDLQSIRNRISHPDIAADIAADPVNITTPYELMARLLFGPEQTSNFAGEGPLNTDVRPILSYIAPLSLFDSQANILNSKRIADHSAPNLRILNWNIDEDEKNKLFSAQKDYIQKNFFLR